MEFVKAKFPARWIVKSIIAVHIRAEIQRIGMNQKQAADILEVTQPRISDLLTGKIDLFSSDALIDMCEKLGLDVSVVISEKWSD